jgi:hypothetical protein
VGDPVNPFDKYVRRVFLGVLSMVLVFAGTFLVLGHKPWARGVVLGGIASLFNLVIMAGDIQRQGALLGSRMVRPAYGRYALRMAAIAAALVYSATSPEIALWATIPALFATQFVMTCGELLGSRKQEIS